MTTQLQLTNISYKKKGHLHILQSSQSQVNNLFKNTNLKIAFRTNNLYNKLRERIPLNKINSSGIYKLKCKSCNNSYVGKTGRSIGIRHRVHTSYIKTNNPISAYALNILNNRHEYGNADQTNHTTTTTMEQRK